LVVTGDVSVTANGNVITPFDPSGGTSQLTVCVSGGPNVPYENVTLQFGKPAWMHFGSQAIHGVVKHASFEKRPW
jgi:hypothetical protein